MDKKISCAVLLFAILSSFASAQVLGKIDYMEGDVEITRNGETLRFVDIGTPVENLDIVKTSADALASIEFDKASGLSGSIQIVSGSSAVIRQDQIAGSGASEVQLLTGSVKLKVKRLVNGNNSVQVRTPTSVLGVRGTEFVVSSFNGAAIVACKEGEVYCASSSGLSVSRMNLSTNGVSSVPGTMVEILETGKVNSGAFPSGDFEKNWDEIRNKWKEFNVGIVAENPVSFLNQFVMNWSLYSAKVSTGAATLKSNETLKKWLKDAESGKVSGSLSTWVKEKPPVMRDLIAIRPDMVVAMITLFRLQDIIPHVPASAMGVKLSNGQTVKSFIDQYNRESKAVCSAIALFNAAEKQYMLRNDGVTPFSDF